MFSCALVAAGLTIGPVQAQTRRALLIGIDKYQIDAPVTSDGSGRRRDAWTNLEGAVNDVDALQQILTARYGFKAADVHVLRNRDATRARILAETRKWLIDAAAPGDQSFFFYAGHGSQVRNSRTEEADGLDESIVPSDANTGARDLRDKELAALFGTALDRNIRLTVIFDSCYSGSIARGAPIAARFRFIERDDRDVADASRPTAPEKRGALVMSAAQDFQRATETVDDDRRPHGLFSAALLKTLRSMPVNQSAERTFLQIRALMHSEFILQDPVLGGTTERRRAPLFGTATQGSGAVAVAVERVEADGSVVVQGGIAAGIRMDSELRQTGDKSKAALRLRVVEEQGLTRSRAIAVDGGSTRQLTAGVLFEISRWTSPGGPALRVWIGSTGMPAAQVRRQAIAMAALTSMPGMTVISDPTTTDGGLNVLQWNGSAWQVISPDVMVKTVGRQPTAAALGTAIGAGGAGALMINLPLPSEAAARLNLGTGAGQNDAIEVLPTAEHADYLLFGRARDNTIEYAWVRPFVAASDARTSALPARTEWIALGADGGGAGTGTARTGPQAWRDSQLGATRTASGSWPFPLPSRAEEHRDGSPAYFRHDQRRGKLRRGADA